MSIMVRLAVITAAVLFFSNIAIAQFLPEDQIPLEVQNQIIADVIAEHGHLDMAALEAAFRDWLLSQPLPDADGVMLDAGTCSDCSPPTEGQDLQFPSVRDVEIVTREGRIRPSFKVKWRRPVRLPREIRDLYELDSYEVFLTRDDGVFEHHQVIKELRADGTERLPRRIRFRRRDPGVYTVHVRPVYVEVEQTESASSGATSGPVSGSALAGSTEKTSSPATRGGFNTGSGPWGGGGPATLSPDSTVDEVFEVASTNTNPALYDCIVDTPGYDGSTQVGQISTLDCSNHSPAITSIAEFEHFSGLAVLDLENNNVNDLTGLAGPEALLSLNLSNNDNIPVNGTFGVVGFELLASLDSITHLYLNDLPLKNIPGLNNTANYITVSLRNNDLSSGLPPVCPAAPPTGDSERVQMAFMDVSGNGLQDTGTRHIAPYIIGTLVAEDNAFENIEPSNCNTLARVSNLHISGNTFPNNNLGANFDLSNYQFDWFSMRNTGAGQLTRLLPEVCASIDLSDNHLALQLTGGSLDLPNAAPYQLDLSGNIGMQCIDVDELSNWYSANVGTGCTVPLELPFLLDLPTSCHPSAPAGLTVALTRLNETQATYQATWQPAPAHWGVTHYRVEYGTSPLSINQSELVPASSNGQATLELTAPTSGQFHFFRIRSCTSANSNDCSEPSTPSINAEYPLLAPQDLEATVFGPTTTLNWSYPPVPPGNTPPVDYVISPVFAVTGAPDEIVVENDTSYPFFSSDIAQYPGGAIQVAACLNVNSTDRECGPSTRLSVLPPPDVDPTIAVPANLALSGSINQHQLTWNAVADDRVDYYLVEDQVAQTAYAVEENHIDLRRFKYQNGMLDFSVRACQRNRDTGDLCSNTNTVSASGFNPSFNLGTPIGLCFFEEDPNNNPANQYYLRWEYNSNDRNLPDNFVITDVNVSMLPNIVLDGTVDFGQAQYDNGTWYWVSGQLDSNASENGDDYFSIHARINPGHTGTSINISPRVFNANTEQEEWNESVRCAETPPIPQENPVRTIGGPGDLNPGHWGQDPERKGNGWRFYWASELRYDDDRDAYRITYDLIGFWYTYRWLTDASGNNGQWSPVWYFSRMILNDRDMTDGAFYQGELIYPHKNAPDENVGSVQVYFNDSNIENVPLPCGDPDPTNCDPSADNQNIWIEIHLDHDDGMATNFGHQLNDTAISHPDIYNNPVNRHDHYSGVWTEGELFDQNGEILTLANNDFFLVEWIEKELHSMGLNFFDSDDDPVWSISTVCENGVDTDSCTGVSPQSYDTWQWRNDDFGIIFPGNNPTAEVPPSWGEVSDHRQIITGAAGRVYANTDSSNRGLDLRQGQFCADLGPVQFGHRSASLQSGNGSCSTINDATTVIDKVASIHDIRFSIGEDEQSTECEISDGNPSCSILLDWSTEDYFPTSQPFYRKDGIIFGHLSDICTAQQVPPVINGEAPFVVAGYPCDINQPGAYEFVLVSRTELNGNNGVIVATDNNGLPEGAEIAVSRTLTVSCPQTDQCPNGVGVSDIPDTALTAPNVHTIANAGSEHNAQIGALAGEAGVSGGAATYSVPINIPPGRQGMQPAVSLSYNSRAGNGTLGMGWSLSAGSSISRCPSTIAQDGFTKGVTYGATDRLCLDGQRLIKVGGSGALTDYWTSGSQYRTEIDSFALVTLNGVSGAQSNGCSNTFTVRGKDNIERTYGSDTDPAATVSPDPVAGGGGCAVVNSWLLSKQQDPAGNDIRYEYDDMSNGEHLLRTIRYTGDASGAGNRRVVFNYVTRPVNDQSTSFLGGYRTRQTQRLNNVQTFVGNEQVRQYNLIYRSSTGTSRSLLETIEECAYDNGSQAACLTPTTFEWGDGMAQFSWEKIHTTRDEMVGPEPLIDSDPLVVTNTGIGGAPQANIGRLEQLRDFDGDGSRELLFREAGSLTDNTIVSIDAEGKERWRASTAINCTAQGDMHSGSGHFDMGDSASDEQLLTHYTAVLIDYIDTVDIAGRITDQDPQRTTPPSQAEVDAYRQQLEQNLIQQLEENIDSLQALERERPFVDFNYDGISDLLGSVPDPNPPQNNLEQRIVSIALGRPAMADNGCFDQQFEMLLTDIPVSEDSFPGQRFTSWLNDIDGDGDFDFIRQIRVMQTLDGVDYTRTGLQLWENMGVNTDGTLDFEPHTGALQIHPDQGLDTNTPGMIYIWPINITIETVIGDLLRPESARGIEFTDINGDGLSDIVINSEIVDFIYDYEVPNINGPVSVMAFIQTGFNNANVRVLLNQASEAGTPAYQLLELSDETVPETNDPYARGTASLGLLSDPRQTYYLPMDVNADGLRDYLLVPNQRLTDLDPDDDDHLDLEWYVQINQGQGAGMAIFDSPMQLTLPGNIGQSMRLNNPASPNPMNVPDFASLIKPVDWDNDGQTELMIPRRVTRPVCATRLHSVTASPGSPNNNPAYGNYCPNHLDGTGPLNGVGSLNSTTEDSTGFALISGNPHSAGLGFRDRSTYAMGIIEFDMNNADDVTMRMIDDPNLGLTATVLSVADDGLGDGITDLLTIHGCEEVLPAPGDPPPLSDGAYLGTSCYNDPLGYTDQTYRDWFLGFGFDLIDDAGANDPITRGYYITRNTAPRDQVLDLMLSATDGFENRSDWSYAPLSSNPPQRDAETDIPLYVMPNRNDDNDYLSGFDVGYFYFASSMYVVSQFNQSNGIDCDLPGDDCMDSVKLRNSTYYGYEEAVYNGLGRGFQGFRKIVSEQIVANPDNLLVTDNPANNLRTVSVFHQIFPLAGRLEASYTQLASIGYESMNDRAADGSFIMPVNTLNSGTYDWGCRIGAGDINGPGQIRALCDITNANGIDGATAQVTGGATGIFHPVMSYSNSEQKEIGTSGIAGALYASSEQTDRSYDGYGNMLAGTTISDNFSAGVSVLKHTQTVTSTYAAPDINGWWINRVESNLTTVSNIYAGVHNPPIGLTGNSRTTTNLYAYDIGGGNPRKPTCEQVVDGNAISQSCGDTSGIWQRTSTDYGQYGNVVKVTVDASDPGNVSIADRETMTTYTTGTNAGYFPHTITNALGHISTTVVDAREGNPVMVTDANGRITKMAYDAFGRETETWYPDGDGDINNMSDIANQYAPRSRTVYEDIGSMECPDVPVNAEYCMLSITDGAPIVRQYFDSLNRVVEVRSNAFRQNASNQQQIVVSSLYNARGQMVRETVPAFDGISVDSTTYEYDALGRTTMKSQPSSSTLNPQMYTHYQHAGLTTTVQVNDSAMPPASCSQTVNTPLNNDLCMQRTYASNGWLLSSTDAHGSEMGYWYDGKGNPVLIEGPHETATQGNLTTATYNNLGHRTQMNDPNMGLWTYTYNGMGEVLTQTDAKQQTTTFIYDQLGRLTQRSIGITADVELGGISDVWEYDDVGLNGLLISETRTQGMRDGAGVQFNTDTTMKTYAYDSYQRPIGYSVRINPHTYGTQGNIPIYALAPVYTMSMEYDKYFGRVKSMTYPGEALREYTVYEINGHVLRQGDSNDYDSGGFWRRVDSMSPINQVVMETLGNGTDQMYHYNPRTFQMEGTDIGLGNGNHQHNYTHDLYGNLITQQQIAPLTPTVTETFEYDHLMRLTSSHRDLPGMSGEEITYAYDRLGNIRNKGDYASEYRYLNQTALTCSNQASNASPGPNAVRSVRIEETDSIAQYGYDGNGNLICGQNTHNGDMSVHYDHTNKPFRIERGVMNKSEFWYDSNDQRYFQRDNASGDDTIYVGKYYEQKGNTQKLYLGGYAVMTIDPTPGEAGMAYLHKDRLGSVIVMSDDSGNEASQTRRGFDPFGKPREGSWEDSNGMDETTAQSGDLNGYAKTTRGFTGHEHLNGTDLIHMNGRAYDYNLGRFLSVDPVIQFPTNSQSLNPYSYIMNNPLSGTDPTGYIIVGGGARGSSCIGFVNGCDILNFGSSNPDERSNRDSGGQSSTTPLSTPSDTPADEIMDPESSGEVCGGFGPGRCYVYRKNGDGILVSAGTTSVVRTKYLFVNGIRTTSDRAFELAVRHIGAELFEGEELTEFTVFHNPTFGIVADGVETLQDLSGNTTELAKQLSSILPATRPGTSVVAHSQGGLLVQKAIEFHNMAVAGLDSASTTLSDRHFAFHGGANNQEETISALRQSGGSLFGGSNLTGFRDHPRDPVPHVIGGGRSTSGNVFSPFTSTLSLPTLFMGQSASPHTLPYKRPGEPQRLRREGELSAGEF